MPTAAVAELTAEPVATVALTANDPPTAAPTRTALPTWTPRRTSTPRPSATARPSPTPRPLPTATPVPLPTWTPAPTLPLPTATTAVTASRETAVVNYVVDGDTIDVTMNGATYRVRYIGIDTPETDQTCGSEAATANAALVAGQTVTMVRDVSETDRYGRLLRYVYVGDTFVNGALVAGGWAVAKEYPPDTAMAGVLSGLMQQGAGIGCSLVAAPLPTQPADRGPAPVGNCDPSYPTVCIPPSPPDLDCGDIPYRRFQVLPPDPHNFDGATTTGLGVRAGNLGSFPPFATMPTHSQAGLTCYEVGKPNPMPLLSSVVLGRCRAFVGAACLKVMTFVVKASEACHLTKCSTLSYTLSISLSLEI